MLKLDFLYCPHCKKELYKKGKYLICKKCNQEYPIKDSIPVFVKEAINNVDEKTSIIYWDKMWTQKNIERHLAASRKKIEFYLNLTGIFNVTINKVQKNSNEKIKIIEIGCGGSQFMTYFMKKFKKYDIWGFDRSFEGCKLAATYDFNIVCADIFDCPIRPNSYDFVYDFTVIHHFKDPARPIKIFYDLVKPGGTLTCVVPNLHGLLGKAIKFIGTETMNEISDEDLYKWFKELEMRDIKVKPIGGIHPLLMIAQSYRSEKQPLREDATLFAYNYILGLPLALINLPFLFRLNSKNFSPFLIAQGVK